jgi:hypothetical protein
VPHTLKHLLEANREWAQAQVDKDPEFFKRLENQQSPEYFWIGCSDSRVPANTFSLAKSSYTATLPTKSFTATSMHNPQHNLPLKS